VSATLRPKGAIVKINESSNGHSYLRQTDSALNFSEDTFHGDSPSHQLFGRMRRPGYLKWLIVESIG
jgi:hypothetical protein